VITAHAEAAAAFGRRWKAL